MTIKIVNKAVLVLLALTLAAGGTVNAMPAKRGNIKYTMPDGNTITVQIHGDERHHYFTTTDGYVVLRGERDVFTYALPVGGVLVDSKIKASDADSRTPDVASVLRGIDREECVNIMNKVRKSKARRTAARVAPESENMTFPTKGSPRLLAVLVEFTDKKFSLPDPYNTFSRYLSENGYHDFGSTGPIADWLHDSSDGLFTPQFDLYGPITLSNDMKYYGVNDKYGSDMCAWQMAVEACQQLDGDIDFSVYDNDNDGLIDNVYVFYAGYGEHDGGPSNSVWPHSWDLEYATDEVYSFDGKRLNHYACSNELAFDGTGTTAVGIGLFCHEFSHVLGLPDLYSTEYNDVFTPGRFSIMDYGGYNNDTRTPPLHTGYERYCLGWVEPAELTGECETALRAVSDEGGYNDVRLITTPKASEYYILENRQQKAWDKYILGHGMLVWHINYAPKAWEYNIVNNRLQNVDIIEADNIEDDPFVTDGPTVSGDPFPGDAGVTSLADGTIPSITPRTGKKLDKEIFGISESPDGIVTFCFRDNGTTAVGTADTQTATCRADGYVIYVTTASESPVKITDAAGRRVVSAMQPADTSTYRMAGHGMYIVMAGDDVFKVLM